MQTTRSVPSERNEPQVLESGTAIPCSFWNVLSIRECRNGTRVPKWNETGGRLACLSADFRPASGLAIKRTRAFAVLRCTSSAQALPGGSRPPREICRPMWRPPAARSRRRRPGRYRTFVLVEAPSRVLDRTTKPITARASGFGPPAPGLLQIAR